MITNLTKKKERPVFPFTAIVGQEEMKLCYRPKNGWGYNHGGQGNRKINNY
jgi:hypothetical protein